MTTEFLAGRYRIDGLLGRGGMSEVYYGHDERLDRQVAIKVLRPSRQIPAAPDSPEAVEILDALDRDRKRFLREIRVTAQLEHPGTPAVYDTGVEGSDRLWVVMQLLHGPTLEALLNQADFELSPPPIAWAAAIAAQIAAVLADVHRVDIVHRDIKPSNVMITDGGVVKVLDFGIAILRGAGALPRLTQMDRTVGTPAYMSPEQCLGQAVGAASDIYSLGCLLLELLTGDVPFFATADVSLRSHHLNTPAPSARARRADVPIELDALTVSMLMKDPAARPTATVVYRALRPLSMTSPENGSETSDPTRPFRWPLLAPEPRPTVRTNKTGERDELTETEAGLLLESARALLDDNRPSQAVRLLEDGVERTRHDQALRVRMRHRLGAALFYAGEYTRAASVLVDVGRIYRKYFPANDPDVLECAYLAGLAYAEIGRAGKALPQLRFYVQNADPSDPTRVLETRFLIAQLLAADGYPDEALAELDDLRPLLVRTFGADSVQVHNLDKQATRLKNGGNLP